MPISYVIPCESQWVEGIYRLEIDDRVLGYNKETGTDGPANIQAKELGDRTLYLRDILNAEHNAGHHALTTADFTDVTKIPERALKLNYSTQELNNLINTLRSGTQATSDRVNNLADVNMSYMSVLSILLPYSREYFNTGVDYELFTDNVRMSTFGSTRILKEIIGDDSLDVESTKGLEVGKSYFLMDIHGNNVEEVTVMCILTETRVRFTTNLQHTRTSGYLSGSTLVPQEGLVTVNKRFVYMTAQVDTLADAASGLFYVHRDAAEIPYRKVYYCRENSNTWQEAVYLGEERFYDGSIDDVYQLPSGLLKLRVEYDPSTQANAQPYNIYYMVLKAVNTYVSPDDVRRPVILSADLNNTRLTVLGNEYRSLWDIPQKSATLRVITGNAYEPEYSTTTIYGDQTDHDNIAITLPGNIAFVRPLRIQLKYTDLENTQSRWSAAYVLTA